MQFNSIQLSIQFNSFSRLEYIGPNKTGNKAYTCTQIKSKFILHNARTKSSAYCAIYMHALKEILQVLHILV